MSSDVAQPINFEIKPADGAFQVTAAGHTAMARPVSLDAMYERWSAPDAKPLAKGILFKGPGCYCAQGDLLHTAGIPDRMLRDLAHHEADQLVATISGISRAEAALVRVANDIEERRNVTPANIATEAFGDQATRIIKLMRYAEPKPIEKWPLTALLAPVPHPSVTCELDDLDSFATLCLDEMLRASLLNNGEQDTRPGIAKAYARLRTTIRYAIIDLLNPPDGITWLYLRQLGFDSPADLDALPDTMTAILPGGAS